MTMVRFFQFLFIVLIFDRNLESADWPMWRCDAGRTAKTEERLPLPLKVEFVLAGSKRVQAWEDPLNADLMSFDRLYEPIILEDKLFVGFSDSEKVVAYHLDHGQEVWRYYTEGPVRLPLAGSDGLIYFGSDDGHLYAVNAADGNLRWKYRGAPMDHRALGNRRLISAWPTRGGPVVFGDHVYAASSIWPFMGTFIYALDKSTGRLAWLNDETGSQYIKQPHSAPAFAGVAPQGALVATRDMLIVPGGRSVPAVLDRLNGKQKYFEINAGGKGTGGAFVTADDANFYVHTRIKGTRQFTLHNGVKTAFMPNEPILDGERLYSAEFEKDKPSICAWSSDGTKLWEVEADGRGDLILAGNVLFAAAPNHDPKMPRSTLSAIALPKDEQPAQRIWEMSIDGHVERLIAGYGKLVAVSLEGNITVLGSDRGSSGNYQRTAIDAQPMSSQFNAEHQPTPAAELLHRGDCSGYALWYGTSDLELLNQVIASGRFVQTIVIEDQPERAAELRRKWDDLGWYGSRVSLHLGSPESYRAPPYIANIVVVDGRWTDFALSGKERLTKLYHSVRPYGGLLHLLVPSNRRSEASKLITDYVLEQAVVQTTPLGVEVKRDGALPGSADWTHQYGNVANTIKSDDKLVKLPLGILWFGGNSNVDTLPRHGHGPPEQVVGGRLILEGMNSLTARDVYTGRELWHRTFEDLGTYDVYYDETYANTPLDPAYNQVHIPGANGRGTNYVVTPEYVYIIEKNICRVLDVTTGKTVRDIALPQPDENNPQEWGYIGVYEDVLLGGIGFARYRTRLELDSEAEDSKLSKSKAGFGTKSLDRAASMAIVGFNRHTGESLWKVDAKYSFWHNGIVAGGGKVYLLDRNPKAVEDLLKRRGRDAPKDYRILAIDARLGKPAWEVTQGVTGTWLGYSAKHERLLMAGAAASDRLSSEVGQGMTVFDAANGEVVWSRPKLAYSGPCILHNDLIITNANAYTESAGAYYLKDGSQKMIKNPVSGKTQPWILTRTYGCNTISASENLLSFRSGAAGYYDLLTESGTGNFGGFRSGCTSNLVAANGILNAPDLTRTCSCSYQNQSSIGLVHMPELDVWTIDNAALVQTKSDRLDRIGLNIGAPGDRRDTDGVPWLEYPVVAGDSPSLGIEIDGTLTYFQDHPSTFQETKNAWINSSGVEGLSHLKIRTKYVSPFTLANGIPVQNDADDAEEDSHGKLSITSSDLELVKDETEQIIGIRFENINLASDSKVRSAYIQFTAHAVNDEPTELTIQAQLSGSAPPFLEKDHDVSSRTTTSESIDWKPETWSKAEEAGELQRTPDLAPLIRSIIALPEWKPGNSIVFLIRGKGKRVATAFAKGKSGAPRLLADADEIKLPPDPNAPKHPYRVRLLFGMPPSVEPTLRRFTVSLSGESSTHTIELDPSHRREHEYVIERVMVGEELELSFQSMVGRPLLTGVEITRLAE